MSVDTAVRFTKPHPTTRFPISDSAGNTHQERPDYLIIQGLATIGFVTVDRAGRSSGTSARWTGYLFNSDANAQRVAFGTTMTRVKTDIAQALWMRNKV